MPERHRIDQTVLRSSPRDKATGPGSNLTYVEAPDLATLACLQNRLNELGENFAIEIRSW